MDHAHVTKVRIVDRGELVLSDKTIKIIDVRLPTLGVAQQRRGEDSSRDVQILSP